MASPTPRPHPPPPLRFLSCVRAYAFPSPSFIYARTECTIRTYVQFDSTSTQYRTISIPPRSPIAVRTQQCCSFPLHLPILLLLLCFILLRLLLLLCLCLLFLVYAPPPLRQTTYSLTLPPPHSTLFDRFVVRTYALHALRSVLSQTNGPCGIARHP